MTKAKQRTYISRRRVAEKALEIVDESGVEGFNIRRLGTALGVNGASLYYHYSGKDEILEDVVRQVLRELRLPDPGSPGWIEWLTLCNLQYRDALLEHRNVVPILLQGNPGRYRPPIVIDYLTECFLREGYDPDNIEWILEVLESFTIGLVLVSGTVGAAAEPSPVHNDEQFTAICQGLIELMVKSSPARNRERATNGRAANDGSKRRASKTTTNGRASREGRRTRAKS